MPELSKEEKKKQEEQQQQMINFSMLSSIAKEVIPLHVSKTFSFNLAQVSRYESVEVIEYPTEAQVIEAADLRDFAQVVNDLRDEGNAFEWLTTIQIGEKVTALVDVTRTVPTGKFAPQVVLADGHVIELSPSENEVFRPMWDTYATAANLFLNLVRSIYIPKKGPPIEAGKEQEALPAAGESTATAE